jgi:hypothetical protein
MAIVQLPFLNDNELAVEQYANEIKNQLASSTDQWRKVSDTLAVAQEEFGRQSKEIRQLGKSVSFSVAKIDKLVQISKCERLKEEHKLFARAQTWTVLYQVTLLDDDQFTTLCGELEAGNPLTTKLVTFIRKPKEAEDRVDFQHFAELKIDINSIRLGLFLSEDYEALISTLETLAEKIPYLKIRMNDLWTKDDEKHFREVEVELDRIVRSKLKKLLSRYFENLKTQCRKDVYEQQKAGVKEEMSALLENKCYKEAFGFIDSDQFDQNAFHNEALQKVSTNREKKYVARLSDPKANPDIYGTKTS